MTRRDDGDRIVRGQGIWNWQRRKVHAGAGSGDGSGPRGHAARVIGSPLQVGMERRTRDAFGRNFIRAASAYDLRINGVGTISGDLTGELRRRSRVSDGRPEVSTAGKRRILPVVDIGVAIIALRARPNWTDAPADCTGARSSWQGRLPGECADWGRSHK